MWRIPTQGTKQYSQTEMENQMLEEPQNSSNSTLLCREQGDLSPAGSL